LGAQGAVSIALWVKPESLGNRWNPLPFTNGAGQSAFHFSLLDDGMPNLAVNTDGKNWVHRRAAVSVGLEQWHHVAVVCDGRVGGLVRFFVDGKPAGGKAVHLGVPLDLDVLRVGAWNNWERQPQNNFHGQIDDVRIYRGLLEAAEMATIAADSRRAPGRP